MIRLPNSSRYAMVTVDTEALPRRALRNHVKHLVWGEHLQGSAGIREMCSIGDEFRAKHVFFVDLCGAYAYLEEILGVVQWLDSVGQDVQLHAHPEVLPKHFWSAHGLSSDPTLMNEYDDDRRSEFVLRHFGMQIAKRIGKDILAFRAGSFRWNACTIRALKTTNIPLSFNNSMRAFTAGQCVYSEPTNQPYAWSNGVIEIPLTEKRIPARPGGTESWASLTYPESSNFPFPLERRSFFGKIIDGGCTFSVFLLHSWSLLYWDENGHATYRDDQRLEGYRRLLARITKDYDVITTRDFLDLYARGKIRPTHTVRVDSAELRR